MENFKDLLIITPKVCEDKNIVKIDTKWAYCKYNGVYDECRETIEAVYFFKDKKLIWLLAYLDMFGEDDEHIDSFALYDAVCNEYNLCNQLTLDSCKLVKLEITYYDGDSNSFNVTFDNIHKRWESMSDEEIWKEVNEVLKNNEDED